MNIEKKAIVMRMPGHDRTDMVVILIGQLWKFGKKPTHGFLSAWCILTPSSLMWHLPCARQFMAWGIAEMLVDL